MFGWFRKPSPVMPAPKVATAHVQARFAAPERTRLYAVGDIHGRADLLEQIIARIAADAATHDGDKRIVFLGDYIDRGPASRQVIERLMSPMPDGIEHICLLGNHESAFLSFHDSERPKGDWLKHGGLETLLSYAVSHTPGLPTPERMLALQAALRERFPASHLEWLKSLPTFTEFGDYYFVHAGIRPGIPLNEQNSHDHMWMRHGWVDYDGPPFDKMIVHGHTISENVEIKPYRIGIDTGAYATGRLTALVLEDVQQRILHT